MSSNSRWYLDTQHSFSFKADTKFRALHYKLNLFTETKASNEMRNAVIITRYSAAFCTRTSTVY